MPEESPSRKHSSSSKNTGMAQADLRRVERCRQNLEQARELLRAAIVDAVASGETYRDIAERAGMSHQRVAQIVKGQ